MRLCARFLRARGGEAAKQIEQPWLEVRVPAGQPRTPLKPSGHMQHSPRSRS
jgi:hypothetical protein